MGQRTTRQKAKDYARDFAARTSTRGWIIVRYDSLTWYGVYDDEEQAESRIGLRDSLGDIIRGHVVECVRGAESSQ